MIFGCDNCGKKYRVNSDLIKGSKARFKCRACSHVIIIHKPGKKVADSPSVGRSHKSTAKTSSKKTIVYMGITVILVISIFTASYFVYQNMKPKSPIIIGCPLSTAFVSGKVAEEGILLAVEEINAAGGVRVGKTRRPFKAIVMDTRDLEPGMPVSKALDILEKLIVEEKADIIMGGPVRSEAALAAMDTLSKHKKISILTAGVLTPKYHALVEREYDKYKYCFRITGEAKWMVKEIISVLTDIKDNYGLNKMHLLLEDVAHSRAGGKIIAKLARQKGWVITGKNIYPTGATDFSRGLNKAKEKEAQVLLIWMDMPESAILLKQWHDLKVPALPFGSFMAAAISPDFSSIMQGKEEFCLVNVVNAGNAPSEATTLTMKFYNSFYDRWGIEPYGYGAASSYMGPYLLKSAIEKAGSLDPGKLIPVLEETDMTGVYGRIKFNQKSHQIVPGIDPEKSAVGTIFQWQFGQRIVIFPPKIATGKLKLPSWMIR